MVGFGKKILAYINKDDFNNVRGEIDPLEYHSLFITWVKLFSVMDCEKMSMWMYISPICTTIGGIIAGFMCFLALVNSVKIRDITRVTESGTYLILMTYQLLIVFSAVGGKKQYHYLVQALKDDFHYICTTGQKFREKFFENQRLTFQACLFSVFVTFATCIGMAACACLTVVLALFQGPNAQRSLPFPIWLFDCDIYSSPAYEILFISSIFFIFLYAYNYTHMMQSHVIWIREITCKADIITWNLQDMLIDVSPAKNKRESEYNEALIKQRMKAVIEMHHSMFLLMKDYAAVYKKCIFFEQMIASPIICMTSFCFVEKYEAGESQYLLLMLCIGSTMVVFIPNFLCTHLLEKVQSVSDACSDVPFWNAGPLIRPYLVLIMQISMQPLPITAPGFDDISLKTFSTIMMRSYSCFNMLRQADLELS